MSCMSVNDYGQLIHLLRTASQRIAHAVTMIPH